MVVGCASWCQKSVPGLAIVAGTGPLARRIPAPPVAKLITPKSRGTPSVTGSPVPTHTSSPSGSPPGSNRTCTAPQAETFDEGGNVVRSETTVGPNSGSQDSPASPEYHRPP